jgi:hypothetical protein
MLGREEPGVDREDVLLAADVAVILLVVVLAAVLAMMDLLRGVDAIATTI